MAATTRACLVAALVVALAFVFLEDATAVEAAAKTSRRWAERRRQVHNLLRRLNKPHLASVQSPDGDTIDCVDIYKQPAFDDPLLQNHTIQMQPSYHPKDLHDDSKVSARPITQTWHQHGKCPENTVPIRRIKEEDVLSAGSIGRYGKKMPRSIPKLISVDDPAMPGATSGHKYAVAAAPEDKYYGTKTNFNLWQPMISKPKDFSLAQLWISRGSYANNDLNTIEVGWQDLKGGNWWLQVGGYVVGYWPSSIFTSLANSSASSIMWGGEVYSPNPVQTSTQMGSGHFPDEGFGKASYIRNIQVVASSNILKSLGSMDLLSTQQGCYNIQNDSNSNWGTYIYYGGPGKNPNCVGKN